MFVNLTYIYVCVCIPALHHDCVQQHSEWAGPPVGDRPAGSEGLILLARSHWALGDPGWDGLPVRWIHVFVLLDLPGDTILIIKTHTYIMYHLWLSSRDLLLHVFQVNEFPGEKNWDFAQRRSSLHWGNFTFSYLSLPFFLFHSLTHIDIFCQLSSIVVIWSWICPHFSLSSDCGYRRGL